MKWWVALALAGAIGGLVFLASPGVAQGDDWLRSGHDPGRTGAIPFEGPQTNDTAFQVELPGVPIEDTLLIDGVAYVATVDNGRTGFQGDTSDLDARALWSIELATGDVSKVLDLPEGEFEGLFGDFLLVTVDQDLVAYEIPTGEERWRTTVRPDDPQVQLRFYGSGAVRAGETLYVEFSTRRGGPGPACCDGEVGGVMAVGVTSGEIRWAADRTEWRAQLTEQDPERDQELQRDPYGDGFALAADGDRVYAYLQVNNYRGAPGDLVAHWRVEDEVWALDASVGQALWMRNDTARREVEVGTEDLPTSDMAGLFCCARPVATPTAVHIRLDAFQALNKQDGTTIWKSPAGSKDQLDIMGSFGMGVRGDALIATSPQTVYRLQTTTRGLDWMKTDPDPDKVYGTQPVTIDSGTAYAQTIRMANEYGAPGVEARDLETGELLWEWHHQPAAGFEGSRVGIPNNVAFGPGVMVQGAKDGTVTVVGETEASLGEPEVPEEQYPGVGNETTIDASGAEPGVHGEATRYMVDWGDGTVTGWQEAPTFSHTYNESGEYQAQVYAGNDANQTSSTFVTMKVGEEAPVEPNWIAERFEEGNQDMTFGVLGLAVALGGGAVGVARRKRKQSLLQDELEALEQGFADTREQPSECEALLDNRKARARSLALDGQLDEEQVTVVENRAEELRSTLRRDALEGEFGFLPHSLVAKARQMVEDGRVTSLEKDAFLQAVDEDEMLTSQQTTQVRERIEAWFARDAGGGGTA